METNKIYNENCLETMKRMPSDFVDLTVTSPPYDDLREYHGCEWNLKIFQQVAQELYRVTKPGGVVVWVVNDKTENGSETLTSFLQAIYFRFFIGFNQHDTMIYRAKKPPLTHNRYEQEFEYVYILSKGQLRTFNPLMEKKEYTDKRKTKKLRREKDGSFDIGYPKQTDQRLRYNIWEYRTGGGLSSKDTIVFEHPAIFPEQLAADHIYSWSNECDLIYDPFGGSGTTAKMAHLMKRNWIMSEISEEYCKLAEKRLEPYLNQLTLAI